MFSTYVSLVFLNFGLCWSYSIVPFGDNLDAVESAPFSQDVGEPLILTPLINANDAEKARNLSAVGTLLDGSPVVSYSGFLTVNETANSNLFFWFFPKNGEDWLNASLLLWLQGGPGASSLYGLFNENGPFLYETKLEPRNLSWTNDYNVLYVDQPVGTGFSFTDSPSGYVRTQDEVADHLYEALTQFFQLFPRLSGNKLYLTGESYAGKYIPAVGHKIHTMKMANLTSMNLRGLFMISALTDGLVNGLANFCYQVGVIDSATKDELEKIEEQIESCIRSRLWSTASRGTNNLFTKIANGSDVNLYDYRKRDGGFDPEDWRYVEFLQLPDVRRKIHVGNRPYHNISLKVFAYFKEDMSKSVKSWLDTLLDHYAVAFVGGQYDVRVAHPLVENVLENLEWSGAYFYRAAKVKKRFLVDGVDRGYYRESIRLFNFLIRGAGHMVPKDQPRAALAALNKFVSNASSVELTD